MQRWMSTISVCSLCVCLPGRIMIVCTYALYGCFVSHVCMYGLAVAQALRSPTGIVCEAIQDLEAWRHEACGYCQCIQL